MDMALPSSIFIPQGIELMIGSTTGIHKIPMMGYVRQVNIAHGPQQVNNGRLVKSLERRKIKIRKTN
jgi:hypothetical protein